MKLPALEWPMVAHDRSAHEVEQQRRCVRERRRIEDRRQRDLKLAPLFSDGPDTLSEHLAFICESPAVKTERMSHLFFLTEYRVKATSDLLEHGPGIVPIICEASDHGNFFNMWSDSASDFIELIFTRYAKENRGFLIETIDQYTSVKMAALRRGVGEEMIPLFVQWLSHADDIVGQSAGWGLAEFGDAASPYLPEILLKYHTTKRHIDPYERALQVIDPRAQVKRWVELRDNGRAAAAGGA